MRMRLLLVLVMCHGNGWGAVVKKLSQDQLRVMIDAVSAEIRPNLPACMVYSGRRHCGKILAKKDRVVVLKVNAPTGVKPGSQVTLEGEAGRAIQSQSASITKNKTLPGKTPTASVLAGMAGALSYPMLTADLEFLLSSYSYIGVSAAYALGRSTGGTENLDVSHIVIAGKLGVLVSGHYGGGLLAEITGGYGSMSVAGTTQNESAGSICFQGMLAWDQKIFSGVFVRGGAGVQYASYQLSTIESPTSSVAPFFKAQAGVSF